MIEITVKDWSEFKKRLANYAALSRDKRQSHIFRGLGNSLYSLKPTLDRNQAWRDDDDRQKAIEALHEEFKEEAIRLQAASNVPDGDALEFLARHYGLPSPLLDWTKSPYVAAYFAYRGGLLNGAKHVAIWNLNLGAVPDSFDVNDIVADLDMLRFNPRAKQQRGVFVRVSSIKSPLEQQLGDALRKFVLPSEQAAHVLAELDEMMVNSTNLNYDLSGAAETAELRVERLREKEIK